MTREFPFLLLVFILLFFCFLLSWTGLENHRITEPFKDTLSKKKHDIIDDGQPFQYEWNKLNNALQLSSIDNDKCPFTRINYYQYDGNYILRLGGPDIEKTVQLEFSQLSELLSFWTWLTDKIPSMRYCRTPFQEELQTIDTRHHEMNDTYQDIEPDNDDLQHVLKKDDKPTSTNELETKVETQNRNRLVSLSETMESLQQQVSKNEQLLKELSSTLEHPDTCSYIQKKKLRQRYDSKNQTPWKKQAISYQSDPWNIHSVTSDESKPYHSFIQEKNGDKENVKQRIYPPQEIERVQQSKDKIPHASFPYEYPARLSSVGQEQIGWTVPYYELGSLSLS